jgi:hypothetical protein
VLRSSIHILKDYPTAEKYPLASFEVMDIDGIHFSSDDVYMCCSMKIVEVGPIAGEKLHRQIRVANVQRSSEERVLVFSGGGRNCCDTVVKGDRGRFVRIRVGNYLNESDVV